MFRSESFIMSVVIRSLILPLKVHDGVLYFHVGNATLKKLGVDLTQGGLPQFAEPWPISPPTFTTV